MLPSNQEDETATAKRLEEISRIERPERPARDTKIRLRHTLKEKDGTEIAPAVSLTFEIPTWLKGRIYPFRCYYLIEDFTRNALFLTDPEHGPFTRARFLAMYEEIMRFRLLWAGRDKEPTESFKVDIYQNTKCRLYVAADFLRTTPEALLLAIMTHAVMTRDPKGAMAPCWSDMAYLQACQLDS